MSTPSTLKRSGRRGWALGNDAALRGAALPFVSAPFLRWEMGDILERNTVASRSLILGELRDIASRALFCRGATAPRWAGLRSAAEAAVHLLGPLALTSVFRPTGTHQYGAIDLAPVVPAEMSPRFASSDFVRRPLLLYARLPVVAACLLLTRRYPWLTIGIEDNHFHLQDDRLIPPAVRRGIPRTHVIIKGEARGTAAPDDADFSGEPGLYGLSESDLGMNLEMLGEIVSRHGGDIALSRSPNSFDVSHTYTSPASAPAQAGKSTPAADLRSQSVAGSGGAKPTNLGTSPARPAHSSAQSGRTEPPHRAPAGDIAGQEQVAADKLRALIRARSLLRPRF